VVAETTSEGAITARRPAHRLLSSRRLQW
jgi:hypothetical protein